MRLQVAERLGTLAVPAVFFMSNKPRGLSESKAESEGKRGPKPSISRAKIKAICKRVAKGVPQKYACIRAGVGVSTYFRWLSEAEFTLAPGQQPTREQLLSRELRDALENAKAEAIEFHVSKINLAARRGNWKASAWRLKTLDREEFEPTLHVENEIIAPSEPIPVAVTFSAMDERFAAALKRAYGKE